jgi:hypothetical protein
LYRGYLVIAAETYKLPPDALSEQQWEHCRELLAHRILENEELEEARKDNG